MRFLRILGSIGQWLGLFCSIFGLILLFIYTNILWTFTITLGSLVWGVGTKLKYYASIKAIEEIRGKKISLDELLTQHNLTVTRKRKTGKIRS